MPMAAIQGETGADELMLTAHIYDHAARLRSFELASHATRELDQPGRREALSARGER
jgi:ribosomal protein S24E